MADSALIAGVHQSFRDATQMLLLAPSTELVIESDAASQSHRIRSPRPSVDREAHTAVVNISLAFPGRVLWRPLSQARGAITMCATSTQFRSAAAGRCTIPVVIS